MLDLMDENPKNVDLLKPFWRILRRPQSWSEEDGERREVRIRVANLPTYDFFLPFHLQQ